MLRRAVITAVLFVVALQPVFADDFKFKVTSNKDYNIGLTIFDGPLMLVDACWAKASVDLDWLVVCDIPGVGETIVALSNSDEEKCEDFQIGVFGGSDGVDCVATLFSNGGTGKGNGSLRFTGTEFLSKRANRSAPISTDLLPGFRAKIEEAKAAVRKRKAGK